MQSYRFVLQARDPDYGHPAFETLFVVERLEDLRAVLGIDANVDPTERWYDLEPDEVVAVTRRFGVPFDPEGRDTSLYSLGKGGAGPPYLVHTDYELVLMLEGRKQFARMGGDFYPPRRHDDEDLFDRYVEQGLLHKEEDIDAFAAPTTLADGRTIEGIRTVYYTRIGEEWRIPAWKLISKAAAKSGWNQDFERMEGMLFGYEDWQNDWWLENVRLSGVRWGSVSLHLAVTSSELAAIDDAGHRALPLRTKPLRLLSAMWEKPDEEARHQLLQDDEAAAVVRFSVKARPFLEELAGDRHARLHVLPANRVKELNRLIVGDIEIVMRRDAAQG
jgi:hypothetical protein